MANRDEHTVKEIARVLNPEAFEGKSENGRLDEADAYAKAEEVYDVASELIYNQCGEDIHKHFKDQYLISAETMTDLREQGEFARKNDVGELAGLVERAVPVSEWLDENPLELENWQ